MERKQKRRKTQKSPLQRHDDLWVNMINHCFPPAAVALHGTAEQRGERSKRGEQKRWLRWISSDPALSSTRQLQGPILPHHPLQHWAQPVHGLPRLGETQGFSGKKGSGCTVLAGARVVEHYGDRAQLTALALIIPVTAAS